MAEQDPTTVKQGMFWPGWALPLLLVAVFVAAWSCLAAEADAGTVGYWRFEDSPGFLKDSGSNGLDLTAVNGPVQVVLPGSGAGSAFHDPVPQTGDSNRKAADLEEDLHAHFSYPDNAYLPSEDFSVEAYVNLESSSTNKTRAIASQWGNTDRSWALLVTKDASGYGPRNLLLQISTTGTTTEYLDSDIVLEAGKDYYVAVTVDLSDTSANGVVFYCQDLTAGGPLQSVKLEHTVTSLYDSSLHFRIGAVDPYYGWYFDGLIDEVRLSDVLLTADKLLANVGLPGDDRPGDANRDGVVNGQDASILAGNWLASGASWSMGDFNDDDIVDDKDATLLAANWNWQAPGATAVTVPEPSAVAMLFALAMLATIASGNRRRRVCLEHARPR